MTVLSSKTLKYGIKSTNARLAKKHSKTTTSNHYAKIVGSNTLLIKPRRKKLLSKKKIRIRSRKRRQRIGVKDLDFRMMRESKRTKMREQEMMFLYLSKGEIRPSRSRRLTQSHLISH